MLFVPQWLLHGSQDPGSPLPSSPDAPSLPETFLSAKLEHYIANGARPPSARVDPAAKREAPPLSITALWRYGAFVATKATELASDFLSHHIWGPRRKSWGIEMTLLSAFMRNIAQHSTLTNLPMLRALIQISGLVPLPSDAIVTPVTFRVHRRRLRGFLKEVDAKEDGSRILSGEWVVGKRLWQRLQNEWRRTKPDASGLRQKKKERVVLFLHGGAYYMFSIETHRMLTIALSKYTDARVFAVDYRLAPETIFPGQLHDAVVTYLRLIEDLKIPPENILVVGDSAGGGLTLSMLLYLRDNGYPLPSGAILMSPWVDLTMSCDSWDSNAEFDLVPTPTHSHDSLNPVFCFLGEDGLQNYLTHPYASPLFGDMHGLPPILIQSGDAEVLRDEATLLAHKATLAGVQVRHELYEDQVHVFQMFFFLESAKKAMMSCRRFVKAILPLHATVEPKEFGSETEAGLKDEIRNASARVVRGDGTIESKAGGDVNSLSGITTPEDGRGVGSPGEEDPTWGFVKVSEGNVEVANKSKAKMRSDLQEHREAVQEKINGEEEDHEPGRESPIMFISRKSRSRENSSQHTNTSLPSPPTSPEVRRPHYNTIAGGQVRPQVPAPPSTNATKTPPGSLRRKSRGSMANMSITSKSATGTHGQQQPQRPPPPTRLPSAPSIRSRARVASHPDIFHLVQSWADHGPANAPVHVDALDNARQSDDSSDPPSES